MIYLIDPKQAVPEKCPLYCSVYKDPCPLDLQHPLYGIPD